MVPFHKVKVIMLQGHIIVGKVKKKDNDYIISDPLIIMPTQEGKIGFSSMLPDITENGNIVYHGTDIVISDASSIIAEDYVDKISRIKARKSGIITPQQPNNGLILPQ